MLLHKAAAVANVTQPLKPSKFKEQNKYETLAEGGNLQNIFKLEIQW